VHLQPGDRIEFDDGANAVVTTRLELVVPGVVACDTRVGDVPLLALMADTRAHEPMRQSVDALLRAMRPRVPGALGPVRRARRLAGAEQSVGYREAASSPELQSQPVAFFSLEPNMLLSRVLTSKTRTDWPANVVARVAIDLASAMTHTAPARLDPFSVGLAADGAWLLDPALDTLLRPEVRDAAGLRGAVAWMGYLAPETIRRRVSGVGVLDHFVALHGLGVLLHELLMGEALYGGETPLETLIALRRGLPPSLSQSIPDVPLDLAAVVHALLDHDPLRRPDPQRVIELLTPIAAPDLSWTDSLRDRHERPLDFLRTSLRRER